METQEERFISCNPAHRSQGQLNMIIGLCTHISAMPVTASPGKCVSINFKSLKFFSYCGNSTNSLCQRSTTSWVQLWTEIFWKKNAKYCINLSNMLNESVVWDTHLHRHTFRRLPTPPELLNCDVLVFSVQVAVFVGLLLLHVLNNELQIKKMNPWKRTETLLWGNLGVLPFLLHGIGVKWIWFFLY